MGGQNDWLCITHHIAVLHEHHPMGRSAAMQCGENRKQKENMYIEKHRSRA